MFTRSSSLKESCKVRAKKGKKVNFFSKFSLRERSGVPGSELGASLEVEIEKVKLSLFSTSISAKKKKRRGGGFFI